MVYFSICLGDRIQLTSPEIEEIFCMLHPRLSCIEYNLYNFLRGLDYSDLFRLKFFVSLVYWHVLLKSLFADILAKRDCGQVFRQYPVKLEGYVDHFTFIVA